jgi:acyl dehydratase
MEPVLPEGRINEESLRNFRQRIGKKLRISWQFNELASAEAIRNWAYGIGDSNPLWLDEDYAAHTRYKTIVAPPSWLYSVFPTYVQQGLPGVHAFHSGNDWRFYRPVVVGDKIRPECIFTGFKEKSSRFAGKLVMEYQEARYSNQRDELVAKVDTWLVRTERRSARKRGKYSTLQLPHPWHEQGLKEIEDEVRAEHITGAQVRWWEEVTVGEDLPALVKGPIGLTDMLAFFGASGVIKLVAHGMARRLYDEHPSWGFRDPNTYAMEPIAGVHWNVAAAHSAGLPYPYDAGIQRNSWLIHFLTNWIGDEGWIKSCYAEYRRFVYLSDVIWFQGKVVGKYIDENTEHCVDIELHGVNQRGEDTIPGKATVILPSRHAGAWPLEKRHHCSMQT